MFEQMGLAALFSIIVSFLPLIAAAAYLFRPTEQRLAMMRPLSLAGIFAGLNGSSLGAINTLRGLWLEPPRDGRILADRDGRIDRAALRGVLVPDAGVAARVRGHAAAVQ